MKQAEELVFSPNQALYLTAAAAGVLMTTPARLAAHIITDALAFRLSELDRTVLLDAYLTRENRSVRRLAQRVIWAAPVFQAPRVFREISSDLKAAISEFQYAPWLVANLSLRGFPEEGRGAPLSWDNVPYDSDALGYVVATHQH